MPSAVRACDSTDLFSTSEGSSNALMGLGVSRNRASSSTKRSFLRADSTSLGSLMAVGAVELDRTSESMLSAGASELSDAFSSSIIPSNSCSSGGHDWRGEGMFIAVGILTDEAFGVGILVHDYRGDDTVEET